MSDFSKNLKLYRKKCSISQEALAARLNVTRQTISNWETDKSYPDLDTIVRLAEILETDTNNLLYPPEKMQKRISYRPVSYKAIWITPVIFFFMMTFGSSVMNSFWHSIIGGGVAESYLYPIYTAIILLVILIVACTCMIIEELRNLDFYKNSDEEN